MLEIKKPNIVVEEMSEDGRKGKFVVEPLERGYGITLGNSLRRIMLSSLEGCSVTAIKIDGIQHEISKMDGVKEDVTDIVLNLKQLIVKINGNGPKTVEIAKKRIQKTYEGISFVNIAYDHMRYVFVINNTTEPVAGVVDGLPYSSEIKVKHLWDAADNMTVPEGNWEYELPPYGVAGWVIYREK